MSKVSKYYEKKRLSTTPTISKEEQRRRKEIEECCLRARARRLDKNAVSADRENFRQSYFTSLRSENSSKIYPSLIENKPNAQVTAKHGLIEQKMKLNSLPAEMREREERAINEALQTAKSVAPAYNKGGYQLISKSDLHSIGKKL